MAAPSRPVIPEDSPYVDLLRRCTSRDVAVRRLALQEYLELELAVLDPRHSQRSDRRFGLM